MMSKTDEYRARTEEYDFMRASVPASERRANENVFEWTLRCVPTSVLVILPI